MILSWAWCKSFWIKIWKKHKLGYHKDVARNALKLEGKLY